MSPEYVAEWVRKAEADRIAARRAWRDSRDSADQAEIACFHAQQCVEKYLKALLARKGGDIPRTHDLPALARRIKDPRFPSSLLKDDLRLLNQYGVDIRYPGFSATVAEGRKSVGAMERARRAARRVLRKPRRR